MGYAVIIKARRRIAVMQTVRVSVQVLGNNTVKIVIVYKLEIITISGYYRIHCFASDAAIYSGQA